MFLDDVFLRVALIRYFHTIAAVHTAPLDEPTRTFDMHRQKLFMQSNTSREQLNTSACDCMTLSGGDCMDVTRAEFCSEHKVVQI